MNVAITLTAAVLLGFGFVLQQRAAQQAPKRLFLRPGLFADLLRRRGWLAGLALMIAGDLLSAWALGHLELSLAEPLLTSNLIFALLLAVPLSRQPLSKSEVAGALLLCGGVACLAVALSAAPPGVSVGSVAYWPAAAGVAAVAWLFVRAGRRHTGQRRATLTGVGAGLVFGIADALTRRAVEMLSTHSLGTVLTSWPAWAMVAATVTGLWLMESAFNAAPLHASLPAITAGEPVAGMLLGVVVFGDVLPVSPGMLTLQVAGLAALIIGVIIVARAPALSSLAPARLHPHRPRAATPGAAPPGAVLPQPSGQAQPTASPQLPGHAGPTIPPQPSGPAQTGSLPPGAVVPDGVASDAVAPDAVAPASAVTRPGQRGPAGPPPLPTA